jgi:hypothetical protein
VKTVNENEKDPSKLAMAIRHLVEGRTNAAGRVTLRASQTTTTVTNNAIPASCYPQLTAASATAAAAWATTYVSSVVKGSFVITHSSTADVDKHVHWHAIG